MAAGRIAWLDDARAFAITLVVLGHGLYSVERAGTMAVDEASYAFAEKAIYSFHMPLFFVLAGLTAGLTSCRGATAVARTLLVGYLWPYLLWSLVILGLKSAFSGVTNVALSTTDLPLVLLVHPVDQMWFLYTLLLIRVAWMVVDAVDRLWFRNLAVLVPLTVAFIGAGPSTETIGSWLFFWGAFYGLGRMAGAPAVAALRPAVRLALAAAAFAIWLAILLWSDADFGSSFGPARTILALSGCLATLALVSLAPAAGGRLGRLVGFVGEASMAIYVTHTVVGVVVRLVLGRLGWLDPLSLLVGYLLFGLAMPTLAYALLLWASARWKLPLVRLAGFGTARRSAYFDLAAGARPE